MYLTETIAVPLSGCDFVEWHLNSSNQTSSGWTWVGLCCPAGKTWLPSPSSWTDWRGYSSGTAEEECVCVCLFILPLNHWIFNIFCFLATTDCFCPLSPRLTFRLSAASKSWHWTAATSLGHRYATVYCITPHILSHQSVFTCSSGSV